MGKKGKVEIIYCFMFFNFVSGFVKIKIFRVYISIINIFYCFWIDDYNSCLFDFFWFVGEFGYVKGFEFF